MVTLVALAILLQADSTEIPPLMAQVSEDARPQVQTPPPVPPPSQPTSVISIVRPGALSEDLAHKLEDEVRRALGEAGTNVQPDVETKKHLGDKSAAQCTGNLACYSLLATLSRSPVMVIIEASAVQQDLAVVLQAVSAADGKLVADTSFVTASAALETHIGAQLQPFAYKVSEAASKASPVVVADAPVRPQLVPEEKPVFIETKPEPTVEPSRLPAVLTGVGSLAAAVVAVAFTANGVSAQSCLDGPLIDGRPTVCVSQERALQMRSEANRNIAIGAGAGAVSVALAAAAGWLWKNP